MTYYTEDEMKRLNAEYARVAKAWRHQENSEREARAQENERQRIIVEQMAVQKRDKEAARRVEQAKWRDENARYWAASQKAEAKRKAKLAARTEHSGARERRSRINWLEVTGEPMIATRQINWERRASALAMRKAGLTFREIGERLDVCRGRAQQMVDQAEREAGKRSPAEVWMGEMKINPDLRGWQAKLAVRMLWVMPKHDPEADWIWAGLAA